mgnify:FL=1
MKNVGAILIARTSKKGKIKMKKAVQIISIIAILAVTLITLTGCMNINYEVKLNNDGSAEISYLMGYDKQFLKDMGISTDTLKNDETMEEAKASIESEGYTTEAYEDDNTYGFRATKSVENIEDFDIELGLLTEGEQADENNKIKYEKNLLNTKFAQDAKLDLTNMLEESTEETSAMLNTMIKKMKMVYKITLPFKAGNNNATTVSKDGKTLEWVLMPGEINEVKFEAAKSPVIIYAIMVIVIAGIAVAIVLIINKNKNKSVVAETENKEEIKQDETNHM